MQNYLQPGENITVLESLLVHPDHTGTDADNKVLSGDPCVVGSLTGVAAVSAVSVTDNVVIKTKGAFNLSVTGTDAGGNSAVAFGDEVYIDGATAVLTKNATKKPYGIALGAVAGGATGVIAVKLFE